MLLFAATLSAGAQQYSFTFKLKDVSDTMLYIAQHYRDEIKLVDSTRLVSGKYLFKGNRNWEKGIYALVRQNRTEQIGDFAIDGSRKFTISGDSKLTPASVSVQGCPSNQQMFSYMARRI